MNSLNKKKRKREKSNSIVRKKEDPYIRKDIVEKFRKEIANSTYIIKSNEIAEKIAQKLKEEESLKM